MRRAGTTSSVSWGRAYRFLAAATLIVGTTSPPGAAKPGSHVPVNVVTTAPGAQFHGYAPPVVVTEQGGLITYVNLDIARHDFVHDTETDGVSGPKKQPWCKSYRKQPCPLFWTPQIGIGQQTEVLGLENVKAGEMYSFLCTLHVGMRGTLVVRP